MKRLLDFVVGTILVVLLLPVMVVLAAGCAFILRSSPLFLHERIGYQGRRFRMPKLRTLPTTVSTSVDKYHVAELELPRFTQFLRRTHLDELPQLLLVPFGRMSLVGPRPEMPKFHAEGDPDFALMRVTRRPGCTGLWQIGADVGSMIWESPGYDRFYVDHASTRLDLWILWRSALLLLGLGRPATLDQVPAWACRRGPARVRAQAPSDPVVAPASSVGA